MAEISFTVPGILPGWQRAGKVGKRHYTQRQTAGAEAEVAAWGRQAMAGRDLLAGPLGMCVTVSSKRKPTSKPDWDNFGKLVSDALNGVAYRDDAAIVDARVVKMLGAAETVVRVWEVE